LVNTYPGVQCDVPAQIYVSMIISCCWFFAQQFRLFRLTPTQTGVISMLAELKFRPTSKPLLRSGILIEISNWIRKSPRPNGKQKRVYGEFRWCITAWLA
jgi:hypothetical protein